MAKTKIFDNYADKYENWFNEHPFVYKSELKALQKVIPKYGKGVEIGVGPGLFAQDLGIQEGIEPSEAMREKAQKKILRC